MSRNVGHTAHLHGVKNLTVMKNRLENVMGATEVIDNGTGNALLP